MIFRRLTIKVLLLFFFAFYVLAEMDLIASYLNGLGKSHAFGAPVVYARFALFVATIGVLFMLISNFARVEWIKVPGTIYEVKISLPLLVAFSILFGFLTYSPISSQIEKFVTRVTNFAGPETRYQAYEGELYTRAYHQGLLDEYFSPDFRKSLSGKIFGMYLPAIYSVAGDALPEYSASKKEVAYESILQNSREESHFWYNLHEDITAALDLYSKTRFDALPSDAKEDINQTYDALDDLYAAIMIDYWGCESFRQFNRFSPVKVGYVESTKNTRELQETCKFDGLKSDYNLSQSSQFSTRYIASKKGIDYVQGVGAAHYYFLHDYYVRALTGGISSRESNSFYDVCNKNAGGGLTASCMASMYRYGEYYNVKTLNVFGLRTFHLKSYQRDFFEGLRVANRAGGSKYSLLVNHSGSDIGGFRANAGSFSDRIRNDPLLDILGSEDNSAFENRLINANLYPTQIRPLELFGEKNAGHPRFLDAYIRSEVNDLFKSKKIKSVSESCRKVVGTGMLFIRSPLLGDSFPRNVFEVIEAATPENTVTSSHGKDKYGYFSYYLAKDVSESGRYDYVCSIDYDSAKEVAIELYRLNHIYRKGYQPFHRLPSDTFEDPFLAKSLRDSLPLEISQNMPRKWNVLDRDAIVAAAIKSEMTEDRLNEWNSATASKGLGHIPYDVTYFNYEDNAEFTELLRGMTSGMYFSGMKFPNPSPRPYMIKNWEAYAYEYHNLNKLSLEGKKILQRDLDDLLPAVDVNLKREDYFAKKVAPEMASYIATVSHEVGDGANYALMADNGKYAVAGRKAIQSAWLVPITFTISVFTLLTSIIVAVNVLLFDVRSKTSKNAILGVLVLGLAVAGWKFIEHKPVAYSNESFNSVNLVLKDRSPVIYRALNSLLKVEEALGLVVERDVDSRFKINSDKYRVVGD